MVRRAYRKFYMQPHLPGFAACITHQSNGWKRDIKAGWKVLRFAWERQRKNESADRVQKLSP